MPNLSSLCCTGVHVFISAEGLERGPSGCEDSFADFLCLLTRNSGLDVHVGIKIGEENRVFEFGRRGQSYIVLGDCGAQWVLVRSSCAGKPGGASWRGRPGILGAGRGI